MNGQVICLLACILLLVGQVLAVNPPTNFKVTDYTSTYAAFSWTASTGGTGTVTYTIVTTNTGAGTNPANYVSTGTGAFITGLTPGINSYTFTITATDSLATSSPATVNLITRLFQLLKRIPPDAIL